MNESCGYSVTKIEITVGSGPAGSPTPQVSYLWSPLPVLFLCQLERLADRKSTRLNSSHITRSRMPSSA